MDAYELYSVPFDEAAILKDVEDMREVLIHATSSNAKQRNDLMAQRTGRANPSSRIRYENFERQLTLKTEAIKSELVCQIEQRRVMPKMKKPETGINITYHLQDNARLNFQSTDESVNTISQEQLFSKVRDVITQQVAAGDQANILQKLEELEKAQGTNSFGEKLSAFIAATADYVTILTPVLPAIAELARKYIGS